MTDEQANNGMDVPLEDKLVLVATKIDPTSDGLFKRILIGKTGESISGALYLDTSKPLPKAIILNISL